MTARRTVPFSRPSVEQADIDAVLDVLRSGQLALGSRTIAFERGVAAYVGARHGVAVSSGTAALHLSVVSLGIGPGDEVVTTPLSFVPSANCIVYAGARPVFVDIELGTLGPDPRAVADAVTARTRSLLIAHLFHQPVAVGPLRAIARRHGLALIEDACEVLGAAHEGERAGALGDAAAFGFYPNKQITTGEGGMVITQRDDVAEACRLFRDQGRLKHETRIVHDRIGFNYRLDEMSAALGASQLERVDALIEARARVARAYEARLAPVELVTTPRIAPTTTRASWFTYAVQLREGIDRDVVIQRLRERGVESRGYFDCIHLQAPYRERFGYRVGQFPVAEAFARQSLALPLFPAMGDADVDAVCDALTEVVTDRGVFRSAR